MNNGHYEVGDLLVETSIGECPAHYLVLGVDPQGVYEDDGTYQLLSLDTNEVGWFHCGWVNGRHWRKVA